MEREGTSARNGKILTVANVVVSAAILAVLAASCWAVWAAAHQGAGGLVAVVHDSAGKEYRLPLSQDTVLTVYTDEGTNVVQVEGGAVSMADADCDGGDCIQQGSISTPGAQIICLPHKLWVEVVAEGDEGADGMDVEAVSGGDAFDVVAR